MIWQWARFGRCWSITMWLYEGIQHTVLWVKEPTRWVYILAYGNVLPYRFVV